jgi:hypothetical protein
VRKKRVGGLHVADGEFSTDLSGEPAVAGREALKEGLAEEAVVWDHIAEETTVHERSKQDGSEVVPASGFKEALDLPVGSLASLGAGHLGVVEDVREDVLDLDSEVGPLAESHNVDWKSSLLIPVGPVAFGWLADVEAALR